MLLRSWCFGDTKAGACQGTTGWLTDHGCQAGVLVPDRRIVPVATICQGQWYFYAVEMIELIDLSYGELAAAARCLPSAY